MIGIGSDPRRLPLAVLADELAETRDAVRVAALARELRRRRRDRAAGERFVVWLYGADDLIVMDRALLAAAVAADGPPPPAAA